MSFDQFASSNGEPAAPRPKATPPPPVETDEDLFNFDELLGAKKQKEALNDELDAVLEAVDAAKGNVASEVPRATAKAAEQPAASAEAAKSTAKAAPAATTPSPAAPTPAAKPAPKAAAVAPADGGTGAPTPTIIHQKLSMSPLAAALLAGIVLVNVTLIVVAWTSVQSVKQLVLDVTHDMVDTTSELRAESTRRNERTAFETEPVFGALPEGFRTLEVAKQRMERGEHERARRMLFGLLSVIDRIEQPARSEVEAQAGFLIADSYRIEAQASPIVGGGVR
ncbi:MAG: hypothetical protein JNN27_07885 [Planctomycetes bacterium]|nr:hypothetical protein [Planctomycetota bacterium]